MAQYQTDHWDADRGFPGGPIYAIAQTDDGYLWIGSRNGLFRFDGLDFRLFSDASVALTGPVVGLLTDGEGNLWIRPERPRFVRYRGGVFQEALPGRDEKEIGATAMCRGRNGEAIFSGHVSDTVRYSRGKFTALTNATGFPHFLVISIAETPDGDIWMGTRDAGLVSLSKGTLSSVVQGLPNRKINCILPASDHDVWVGTDSGVVRWNGIELTRAGVPGALQHTQVFAMIRDRQSNIWVGTASGLCRINSQGIAFLDEPHEQSGSAVTALYEDREGNLWVGGPQGLQRYRQNAFLTYRQPDNGGPLYADSKGRTWFAPSRGGLYWLKGTRMEAVNAAGLSADVVYSIAGGEDELWVGRQRKGLTRLRYERDSWRTQTFTKTEGLPQNSVDAVYRSRDGTVWTGTVSDGLSRLKNGKFTTYTTADGLSSNTISAIEEGADGTMYFGTPNGLNALSDNQWHAYTANDGLPPASVNCLSQGSNAVLWIGTGQGLAYLSSGRVQVPVQMPALLYEEILGIAEDRGGWLWIATSNHILEVKRDAILHGSIGEADMREFGPADGLRGTQTVKRDRSVIRDSLGRIWFSMNRSIAVIDPAELASISVPALVHIQGILADDRRIAIGASIRLPAGCQRVTFSYTGLSLSAPEQVKFRYKLDGVDHSWSKPTLTREAVYSHLGWGPYRFRVIASNSCRG